MYAGANPLPGPHCQSNESRPTAAWRATGTMNESPGASPATRRPPRDRQVIARSAFEGTGVARRTRGSLGNGAELGATTHRGDATSARFPGPPPKNHTVAFLLDGLRGTARRRQAQIDVTRLPNVPRQRCAQAPPLEAKGRTSTRLAAATEEPSGAMRGGLHAVSLTSSWSSSANVVTPGSRLERRQTFGRALGHLVKIALISVAYIACRGSH